MAALAVHGAIVFVLGSPGPRSTGPFAHLFILVIMIAFGKRQSEVNDRLVFSALLQEKAQRTQEEFQLSRATIARRTRSDDEEVASGTPMAATSEALTGLDKRRHWLTQSLHL